MVPNSLWKRLKMLTDWRGKILAASRKDLRNETPLFGREKVKETDVQWNKNARSPLPL